MRQKAHERQRGIAQRQSLCRSEEHTSELQSPCNLVCRLLLEKKKHAAPRRSEERLAQLPAASRRPCYGALEIVSHDPRMQAVFFDVLNHPPPPHVAPAQCADP